MGMLLKRHKAKASNNTKEVEVAKTSTSLKKEMEVEQPKKSFGRGAKKKEV